MFCKNCGSQAPDGALNCPVCQAPMAAPQPAAVAAPAQPAPAPVRAGASGFGGLSDTLKTQTKGLPVRMIAKVAMILALVSFILPFFSIGFDTDYFKTLANSFGGSSDDIDELEEIEDFRWGGYSGFNAMFGKLDSTKVYGIDEDMAEELTEEYADEIDNFASGINLSLWISFLLGAGAVAVLFAFDKQQDKKGIISAGLSAGSLLFLIIGRIRFMSNVSFVNTDDYDGDLGGLAEAAMEMVKKMFESHIKWGFLLCLLFMLVGVAACVVDFLTSDNLPSFMSGSPKQFPTTAGYPQAPAGNFPQTPAGSFPQAPVNPAPPAQNPYDNNPPQQPML